METSLPLQLDGVDFEGASFQGVADANGQQFFNVTVGIRIPVPTLLAAIGNLQKGNVSGGGGLLRTSTAPVTALGRATSVRDDPIQEESSDDEEEHHSSNAALPLYRVPTHDPYNEPMELTSEEVYPPSFLPPPGYPMAFPFPNFSPMGWPPGYETQLGMTPGAAYAETVKDRDDDKAPLILDSSALNDTSKHSEEPPEMKRSYDVNSGVVKQTWMIDSQKLQSVDERLPHLDSPPFYFSMGKAHQRVPFKLRISAVNGRVADRGIVHLVCEEPNLQDVPDIKFRLSVGSAAARGPVTHNFSQAAECGLVDADAMWDFRGGINSEDSCLSICIEVGNSLELELSSVGAGLGLQQQLMVKNTFVDISEHKTALPRTVTAPARTLQQERLQSSSTASSTRISSEEAAVPKQPELTPLRPQTVNRIYDGASGHERVEWVVSARKLQSGDSHPVVSPGFHIDFGEKHKNVPFKMMILPRVKQENHKKGGGSFKEANGFGCVELVCEKDLSGDSLPSLKFFFAIGTGDQRSESKGPVIHDFAEMSVARLPKEQALFKFKNFVDDATQTFVVCLEIAPNTGASEPAASEEAKPLEDGRGTGDIRRW